MGTLYEKSEVTRPKGINKDLSPYELPAEMWSDGLNVNFRRNRVQKSLGYTNVYEETNLVISSVYHQYWTDDTTVFWYYADDASIYRTDGTIANTEMLATDFLASRDASWTGCNFNGVLVFNNRNNIPQFYNRDSGAVEDLPNWGTTQVDGSPVDNPIPWGIESRAEVIRPYKNYLVALDLYGDTGVRYSDGVRWSGPATLDDVPPSWDPTFSGQQAGVYNLADTVGRCVDGLTLGDYFVIYKTDAVWLMDFIGGSATMRFRKLFGDEAGILSKECMAEFDGKHFVMSPTGAYIHNGQTKTDIMEQWVRDEFFDNVDPEYLSQTKVVADHSNREVWIYYITKDSLDSWCDRALIWNWDNQQWTIKELEGIAYIGEGIIDVSSTAGTDDWDSDDQAWNDDTTTWNGSIGFNPVDRGLLLSKHNEMTLLANEASAESDGSSFTGYVERIGLDMGMDYSFKEVTRIVPHVLGQAQMTVKLYAEDLQTGAPTLIETSTFDPIQQQYVDCHVVGRYIGIRFEGEGLWQLTGYSMHWKQLGEF